MADENTMKERALLFIDRRIGTLETCAPDSISLAESAVSYGERRRIDAGTEERKKKNQTELEAMQWIRGKLVEMK